jgi:hypothetical protein
MLISPRSTLMSCGKASMRVYRANCPTQVACWAHAGLACCGSHALVRNFSMWKRRPPRAMQVCLSKTGPWLSHLIASATTMRRGKVIANKKQASRRSPRKKHGAGYTINGAVRAAGDFPEGPICADSAAEARSRRDQKGQSSLQTVELQSIFATTVQVV